MPPVSGCHRFCTRGWLNNSQRVFPPLLSQAWPCSANSIRWPQWSSKTGVAQLAHGCARGTLPLLTGGVSFLCWIGGGPRNPDPDPVPGWSNSPEGSTPADLVGFPLTVGPLVRPRLVLPLTGAFRPCIFNAFIRLITAKIRLHLLLTHHRPLENKDDSLSSRGLKGHQSRE